jgi:hypothetical protein
MGGIIAKKLGNRTIGLLTLSRMVFFIDSACCGDDLGRPEKCCGGVASFENGRVTAHFCPE